MVNDYKVVWDNCLHAIQKNINTQSYNTWFLPIKPIKLNKSVLTIQVPNKFFYEWIEEHYIDLLKSVLVKELGKKGRLEYQILVAKEKTTQDRNIPQDIKNPFVIPGIKRVQVNPNLNPQYTLDSFIEGECNRLARNAGLSIARKPGETAFNPLVVYGDVGLGKTHLVQAIGNDVLKNHTRKKVLYVSSEEFTNQIIKSIRENSIEDLIQFYHLIDVLIIDDIQFLANKTKTQEIFFHIFNQLHQNNKQLVITSDRPPKDLNGMEERLISRFKWGLTADLQRPDFETRMAILEDKLEQEHLEMPYDVREYVCYNIQSNIRELEGVLVSLMAQSRLNRRNLDMELAKEIVAKFVSNTQKEMNINSILEFISNYFKVDIEKIKGKTRIREVVIARQLVMYFTKKYTSESLKTIGAELGGRDHSTVIYSCRAVRDLADTDTDFRKTIDDIDKELTMTLSTMA